MLNRLITHRRFRLFGVGTAKSGTHSLASIFQPQYRSVHEPGNNRLLSLILQRENHPVVDSQLRRHILWHDRLKRLELNASQVNYYVLDHLQTLFPNAKYILTIRHPYQWLDSLINHQLARGKPDPVWERFRDLRFQHLNPHPPQESILSENGLYTLDGYLSYWAMHNRDVIRSIPSTHLLIMRTDRISTSLADLAHFADVPINTLNQTYSHTYKARRKYDLLAQIDQTYLSEKVTAYCQPLLDKYFVV